MDQYPHKIGFYRGDTRHLSTIEHGAYRLLIDEYYADERPIPDDWETLRAITKTSDLEWFKMALRIRAFFTTKKGYLAHKRCTIEIERWCRFRKHQSERGKKRHSERSFIDNNLHATAEASLDRAEADPSHVNVSERVRDNGTDRESTSSARARNALPKIPIPQNWTPSSNDLMAAQVTGMTPEEINHEATQFRDYYLAAGAAQSDWSAKWRQWIGRRKAFSGPRARKASPHQTLYDAGLSVARSLADRADD